MIGLQHLGVRALRYLFCLLLLFPLALRAGARTPRALPPKAQPSPSAQRKLEPQEDSSNLTPAKDLALRPEGEHQAEALAHFVEGTSYEENGEIGKALEAYRKVLNVDPGQSELASRVAALLARQDDFPQAIDVLKDAIAKNPNEPEPYLQLAFIYTNRAIALNPRNIEAYQRLYEIELAAGEEKKALQSLDRAAKVRSDDPTFWTKLGKLYASIVFKPGSESKP